ncbi:MAG TPA: hypothetical protein VLS51_04880 [Propionibacteriaceae bacterium]|nr:hypothetical protein [Propionibacteriaceae bacterium]
MSTVLTPPPEVRTAPSPVVSGPQPPPVSRRRTAWAVVVAVLVGLVAIGLTAFWLLSMTTTTTTTTPYVDVTMTSIPALDGAGGREAFLYPAATIQVPPNMPQASPYSEWPPASPTVAPIPVLQKLGSPHLPLPLM